MSLSFQSLNNDAIYEIFKRFVEIDDGGPFILSSVCVTWQEFVLSTPSLWTDLFIGENIGDLDARLETHLILSAGRPLYIYVKMPYRELQKLKPLMLRCHTLDIDISWESFGFRTGTDIISASAEIYKDILRPYPPELKHINWYANSKPIQFEAEDGSLVIVGDSSSILRTVTFKGPSANLPLKMITSLTLWQTSEALHELPFILSKFVHLQDLDIMESWIRRLEASPNDIIYLPFLHNLSIRLDMSDPYINNASAIPIHAPSLYQVTLHEPGFGYRVYSLSAHLFAHIKPLKLLMLTESSSFVPRMPDMQYQLNSIQYLEIHLTAGSRNNCAIEILNSFFNTLPNLQELILHLETDDIRDLELISPPRCVLKLFLSRHTVRSRFREPRAPIDANAPNYFPNSKGIKSHWPALNYQIDDMTVCDCEEVTVDHYWSDVFSISRAITITRPSGGVLRSTRWLDPRLLAPSYWSTQLERFDAEDLAFSSHSFQYSRSELFQVKRGTPFIYLTSIRCLPGVLAHLLSNELVPSLQIVTLTSFTEGIPSNDEEFQELVKLILAKGGILPLYTLGFEFYPNWSEIFKLIGHLVQYSRSDKPLSIRLPGWPHHDILLALISALGGKPQSIPLSNISEINAQLDSITQSGCTYCVRSGSLCELYDSLMCFRHSVDDLVTITQYTI